MLNKLHDKYLKYGAILGLVPYMTPTGQQKYNLRHAYRHPHHSNKHQQQLHRCGSNNHNRLLRWQKIYTLTIIAGNLITTLYSVIFLKFEDNFFISNLVSIIVYVAQIITMISILLETMFSYGKYYELINSYHTVEVLIKILLHLQLCNRQIGKRQRRKYAFAISIVYGSLIASMTVIFIKTYRGYFWYAFAAIVVLRTRSLQMSFYLDFIIYYMELLNIKLKALISSKIGGDYCVLDIDYDRIESFEYLQNLKIIYMEIYSLHEKFNELFGYSFAVLYTVVVLDIIINMYWAFLTSFEYYESYYNYITFSTVMSLFGILFTLCYTADQCEKQCILTLTCLRRLLRTSLAESTECYNSVLQAFIFQILQNPITIDANGYFTVNLKTFMRILSTIATYLVILLQFRKVGVSEEMQKMEENRTLLNKVMELNNTSLFLNVND